MCKAHYWIISTPNYGEHIIGRCTLCGREVDYTVLQEQDKGWRQICLTNSLTRPDVNLDRILAHRTNNRRRKSESQKLSRGRVR